MLVILCLEIGDKSRIFNINVYLCCIFSFELFNFYFSVSCDCRIGVFENEFPYLV